MTDQDLPYLIISDTTLRDGEQMPAASLRPEEKLRLAEALFRAGVVSLEVGFPASSASEAKAARLIAGQVKGPVLLALARCLDSDVDDAAEALAEAAADKRGVSLFVATSPIHRQHKLKKSRPQLLKMITRAVDYARRRFDIVAFAAEDASRTEPDFLAQVYAEAIAAGATAIGFPDTLGLMTPEMVRDEVRRLQDEVSGLDKALLAVHFHNDLGLATANSLAAAAEGVQVVQCTINGIGERAGNAALEEVVLALVLHQDLYKRRVSVDPARLTGLSRLAVELTGVPVGSNKAVVGGNIFATEAGLHQDGLLKHLDTYLPFRPEMVGAEGIQLILGKHSGRAAFEKRLAELDIHLSPDQLEKLVTRVKEADKRAWLDDESLLRDAARELFPLGETSP